MVCDGIEDPHNLGAIIRSAETAGAHGVIIPKRRAVGLTAAVARAAAGALAYIGVHKANNLAATLTSSRSAACGCSARRRTATPRCMRLHSTARRDHHRLGGAGAQPPDAGQVRFYCQHPYARQG